MVSDTSNTTSNPVNHVTISDDNKGWECPRCGRCFAPSVTQCPYCGNGSIYTPIYVPLYPWYPTITTWVVTPNGPYSPNGTSTDPR